MIDDGKRFGKTAYEWSKVLRIRLEFGAGGSFLVAMLVRYRGFFGAVVGWGSSIHIFFRLFLHNGVIDLIT